MIRQPFQLQRDGPQGLSAEGGFSAGQGLDRLAAGRGVPDRRVAGQRLHVVDRAPIRTADQSPLDPAMLVAQFNLQVKHVFAQALEPKMARLDHARVDRPHRHLVHLFPLDLEVVGHAGGNRPARPAVPGVASVAVGGVKADRLQPGMALGPDAPLLGDLALEPVGRRTARRKRRIAVGNVAGQQAKRGRRRLAGDGKQPHRLGAARLSEQGR